MRRIPAFSLIEMLVVMLLSSITVGIIYVTYYSISMYYIRYSTQQIELERANVFFSRLSVDFDECLSVTKLSSGILCSQTVGTVEYHFFPEYSIRRQLSVVDTFPGVNAVAFRYGSQDRVEELGLIDELEISAWLHARQVTLRFVKDYEPGTQLRYQERTTYDRNIDLN